MANQRILATEEMVGYGHATKADTLNRHAMIDHKEDGTHKKPAFSVHKNGTAQDNLTASDFTKITWSTEIFDTDACFASSTFTPNVAGKYLLTATVLIGAAVATKLYYLAIYKNGSLLNTGAPIYGATGGSWGVSVSAIVSANGSTDAFDIYLYNGDTSVLSISGGANNTYFMGCRID